MIFVQIFVVDQSSAKAFFSVFLDILFILFLCLIYLFIFLHFFDPSPHQIKLSAPYNEPNP